MTPIDDLYLNDPHWSDDYVITEAAIDTGGEWYSLSFREANEERGYMGIGLPVAPFVAADLPAPVVGDRLRLCRSLGYANRGVIVNGRLVFYRTEADQRAADLAAADKAKAERWAAYEAKRTEMQARVDALLPEFAARVARFRANNPDFGPEFEDYELNCCEDAQRVIAAISTAEEIADFSRLEWAAQKARVPGITDGQSGNSFGMIVRLAYRYRTDAALVAKEHGALCPLVGCESYGCFSSEELTSMREAVS